MDRPAETGATDSTVAGTYAGFVAGLDYAAIPAGVIERARLHILDAVGIALAASRMDYARRVLVALKALSGSTGTSPLIGFMDRMPVRDAAHLNGALIHGLDYDDTHVGAVTHVTAGVLPAVLAAGHQAGASGAEALAAYVAASEVVARLGLAADGGFHEAGFHATGVLDTFGAALAAGRLYGLEVGQLRHAQGIALSKAAASLEFLTDGVWTKRLHPGWSAVCGLTAARLAQAGAPGPSAPYEGRYGLYAAYARRAVEPARLVDGLGERWELPATAIKPYPSCHFNHAFADAALALRHEHGLEPGQVARITARIGAGQVGVVCEPLADKRRPRSAYEAQFSLPYTIAASLLRGRFTLAELEDEARTDPAILDLAGRTGYEPDPDSAYPRYYSGEVVVETVDGRTLSHREAVNRGSDARPLSAEEIVEKFMANAACAVSPARAEAVRDAVLSLDRAPGLGPLTQALAG